LGLVSWVWLVVFFGISVITFTVTLSHLEFIENSVYATGEIIDYVVTDEGDLDYESYWPIIQFSDKEGYVYKFKSNKADFDFDKGDKRNVRYLINNPNDVTVADKNVWTDVFILAIFCVFALLKDSESLK